MGGGGVEGTEIVMLVMPGDMMVVSSRERNLVERKLLQALAVSCRER